MVSQIQMLQELLRPMEWAQTTRAVRREIVESATSSFQWARIKAVPVYDSSSDGYTVRKLILVGQDWQEDTEDLTVKRALGYEGYSDDEAKDIRNWVPWWPVNSIVRIIERWDDVDNQMRWFIAEPMIYTGKPETATLRHHPTDGIVQCVWQ